MGLVVRWALGQLVQGVKLDTCQSEWQGESLFGEGALASRFNIDWESGLSFRYVKAVVKAVKAYSQSYVNTSPPSYSLR